MKFVPKELKETADASRGATGQGTALKYLLVALICLVGGYFLLGVAADVLAAGMPDDWEVRLFTWEPGGAAAPGPEMERAEAIFQRLIDQPGLRPLRYRLFLLELETPNALAVPGGGVGVTRGLLEAVKSEAGLAMVLGHELGHHQGRHCLRRLGRGLLLKGAAAALFGGDGASAIDTALDLAESSYSRRQESEADEFGLGLVHRALGHTDGCLEFFEHVMETMGSREGPWAAFLSSHPLTKDRIEDLKRLQQELERP